MGDITSETTTNKAVLEKQKAALDRLLRGDGEQGELMRELIEAVRELGNR